MAPPITVTTPGSGKSFGSNKNPIIVAKIGCTRYTKNVLVRRDILLCFNESCHVNAKSVDSSHDDESHNPAKVIISVVDPSNEGHVFVRRPVDNQSSHYGC